MRFFIDMLVVSAGAGILCIIGVNESDYGMNLTWTLLAMILGHAGDAVDLLKQKK